MSRIVHVIGNGDSAWCYNREPRKGLKLTCNLPPFEMTNVFATTMVDFKMMNAVAKGEIIVPGQWILGMRPKIFFENNPKIKVKFSSQIKTFYTVLPKYCPNYTDLSCGHFAVHYAANTYKPDEIHMYGFDSIFDFNLRSSSDFFMHSDRENVNNNRLASNWRAVWPGIFDEFKNVKFVLHHIHDSLKVQMSDNVETRTYKPNK